MLAKTPTAANALIKVRGLLSQFRALRDEGNAVDANKVLLRIERTVSEGIRTAKPGAPEEAPIKVKVPRKETITLDKDQRKTMKEAIKLGLRKIHLRQDFSAKGEGHPFWDEVLPLFEKHRADFLYAARQVAEEIFLAKNVGLGEEVGITVDDVRKLCPPRPEHDTRIQGAIFAGKKWVKVGERKSTREACHYRKISIFVLA